MDTNKTILQSHNLRLETLLDEVNMLPDAGNTSNNTRKVTVTDTASIYYFNADGEAVNTSAVGEYEVLYGIVYTAVNTVIGYHAKFSTGGGYVYLFTSDDGIIRHVSTGGQ